MLAICNLGVFHTTAPTSHNSHSSAHNCRLKSSFEYLLLWYILGKNFYWQLKSTTVVSFAKNILKDLEISSNVLFFCTVLYKKFFYVPAICEKYIYEYLKLLSTKWLEIFFLDINKILSLDYIITVQIFKFDFFK